MTLEHLCRNGLAWAWGHVRPAQTVSTAELRQRLDSGDIRKILLIRPHQGIGDLILATPVFRALQERYPALTLHFVGSPRNAAAVQTNRRLSKTWIWDKRVMRNPARCIGLIRALRRERFDLALVVISNAPSLTSFLIARLSGAPCVGSCQTDALYGGTNWSRRLAHWQTPAADAGAPEHLKFFALAAPLVDAPCPAPEFHIPDSVTEWAKAVWQKMNLTRGPAPTAIFLGGNLNRAGRLWRPASWAALARLLKERKEGPVIAVSPPRALNSAGVREGDFYQEFRRALGEDIPVFDEPGLPQAAAFLKSMALFICPDGGLFHVAAAAGVRTLGLFFDTDPVSWQAPYPAVSILRAPEGLPDKLSPEAVLDAIQRLRLADSPR
ncbi:MAG: hypothetical protein A2992_08960 [Elusimicrobia bacterium RIFCSPLOWO2_01_FULL_59_12]|nr:MAG: hypothetical protein A2992_08960 [Elusimicrobia bacterium RIFCSPLOWO2_01_FULL_59_12]